MLASESGSGLTCETRTTRWNGSKRRQQLVAGAAAGSARDRIADSELSRSAVIVGWVTGHRTPRREPRGVKRCRPFETDDLIECTPIAPRFARVCRLMARSPADRGFPGPRLVAKALLGVVRFDLADGLGVDQGVGVADLAGARGRGGRRPYLASTSSMTRLSAAS